MWFDDLPSDKSWASLWHGYIICDSCRGIRRSSELCPACGAALNLQWQVFHEVGGGEVRCPPAFMGAEGRFEDWIYLQLMEREWKRPASGVEIFTNLPADRRPSERASIVLLFWSYFETRIERLLRAACREGPPALLEDALGRYASIGARLDRLYRIVCGATYFDDLRALGFGEVADFVARVKAKRNAFSHGDPHAIDDALVRNVVENLRAEHESWIAVFNKRAARPKRAS